MIINEQTIASLAWEKMDGLLPAIAQDATSGKVLMQGYMNRDAVEKTLSQGNLTFYSRSKQRLWMKGESSGNTLTLVELTSDCDNDAILALVNPQGPTCHTGKESCWFDSQTSDFTFLADLERVLADRKNADPGSSYTASLYNKGIKRIAQKVGEEGVETALAATVEDHEELKNEAADLLYHLMVLLQASSLSMAEVVSILRKRQNAG